MPQTTIPAGTIDYDDTGPATGRPLVCVPGFLMGRELFAALDAPLAAAGFRVIRLTMPMGAHAVALTDPGAATAEGQAGVLADVLDALDLEDVVLLGNDTGGAICQLTAVRRPQRIGALVLTNCDAFEQFPPPPFTMLKPLARLPRLFRLVMGTMRLAALRRSPLGYGLLSHGDVDHLTRQWVKPMLRDRGVMADIVTLCRSLDPALTMDAADRLDQFNGPALLPWGTDDRLFPIADAHRLAERFGDARVVPIHRSRTFTMVDQPDALAAAIVDFLEAHPGPRSPSTSSSTTAGASDEQGGAW